MNDDAKKVRSHAAKIIRMLESMKVQFSGIEGCAEHVNMGDDYEIRVRVANRPVTLILRNTGEEPTICASLDLSPGSTHLSYARFRAVARQLTSLFGPPTEDSGGNHHGEHDICFLGTANKEGMTSDTGMYIKLSRTDNRGTTEIFIAHRRGLTYDDAMNRT